MIVLGGDVEGDFCCVLTNQRAEPILSCRLPTFETGLVIQSLRCRDTTFEAKSQGWSVPSSGSRHWCPGLKMDHPILLLFGMIAISTLLFALTRSLCRDPELLQLDAERERQRVLAEAVVRHADARELVAIASGRVRAGRGAAGARRLDHCDAEQTGVKEETRESFISMSARREGYLPTGDITAADPLVRSNMASHGVEAEGKRRQASESRQVHSPKSITMASRSHPPASLVPRSLPENARAPSSPGTGGEFVIAGQGAPPPHELTSAPKGSAAMSGEGEAGGLYADNSCSVCLDDYTEGDELLQLTCGHVFHRPCIDLWLKGHCICPTCRTNLDQLAQVAQVFPSTNRRELQKALARAGGNAIVAVELLLTESNRPNEPGRVGGADVDSEAPAGRIEVVVIVGEGTSAEGREARGEGREDGRERGLGTVMSTSRQSGSGDLAGSAPLNVTTSPLRVNRTPQRSPEVPRRLPSPRLGLNGAERDVEAAVTPAATTAPATILVATARNADIESSRCASPLHSILPAPASKPVTSPAHVDVHEASDRIIRVPPGTASRMIRARSFEEDIESGVTSSAAALPLIRSSASIAGGNAVAEQSGRDVSVPAESLPSEAKPFSASSTARLLSSTGSPRVRMVVIDNGTDSAASYASDDGNGARTTPALEGERGLASPSTSSAVVAAETSAP